MYFVVENLRHFCINLHFPLLENETSRSENSSQCESQRSKKSLKLTTKSSISRDTRSIKQKIASFESELIKKIM